MKEFDQELKTFVILVRLLIECPPYQSTGMTCQTFECGFSLKDSSPY